MMRNTAYSRVIIERNRTLIPYSFTSIDLNFGHHSRMMGGVETREEHKQ
jgi:hypothetical protein